jgi:hypothetical protein
MIRGLIVGRGKKFFFTSKRPARLWGPPSILFNWYRGGNSWGFKVTHLHLVPRLRIGGALPPLPTYIFMASRGTTLPFSQLEGISELCLDKGMLTEEAGEFRELQDTALGWL